MTVFGERHFFFKCLVIGKYIKQIIKGTIHVILSDPPFKKVLFRFTMDPVNLQLSKSCENILDFCLKIDNFRIEIKGQNVQLQKCRESLKIILTVPLKRKFFTDQSERWSSKTFYKIFKLFCSEFHDDKIDW